MVRTGIGVPIPLGFPTHFHYGGIKVGSIESPPGLVLAVL